MENNFSDREQFAPEHSAAAALRHHVFNKLTPILAASEVIGDSDARLTIQACCLDLVVVVQELISRYGLDQNVGGTTTN